MNLTPKALTWIDNTARFMGITFSVTPNEHGTYNATMTIPHMRPESEHGLNSIEQARTWCQEKLLPQALEQHFHSYNGDFDGR